jgi:hypothetical protein
MGSCCRPLGRHADSGETIAPNQWIAAAVPHCQRTGEVRALLSCCCRTSVVNFSMQQCTAVSAAHALHALAPTIRCCFGWSQFHTTVSPHSCQDVTSFIMICGQMMVCTTPWNGSDAALACCCCGVGDTENLYRWSNTGACIDVFAPGVDIYGGGCMQVVLHGHYTGYKFASACATLVVKPSCCSSS